MSVAYTNPFIWKPYRTFSCAKISPEIPGSIWQAYKTLSWFAGNALQAYETLPWFWGNTLQACTDLPDFPDTKLYIYNPSHDFPDKVLSWQTCFRSKKTAEQLEFMNKIG